MATILRDAFRGISLLAFFGCAQVFAAVPNTFVAGEPALASEVNENFTNLDTRVTSVESLLGAEASYLGYSLPFSALGAPKNVVVLAQDNGSGGIAYAVRSRYANNTQQVSVGGTLAIPPYIANYVIVDTDAGGNVVSISNSLETPENLDYLDFNVESSVYNADGTGKTVTDDSQHRSFNCTGGSVHICVITTTSSADGSYRDTWVRSRARRLLDSFTIGQNSWFFDDVRVDSWISSTGVYRIYAKGIGEVFRDASVTSGERYAIYYRVNGATKGSLAGTPFAAGQSLEGRFF